MMPPVIPEKPGVLSRVFLEAVAIMTSINTNAAAMTALQTLKSTNKNMDITQNRISTGFRVSEAAHNAAYWSIATTMRSDNNAMSTVKDALGLGSAQVDIAYTAMDVVKDTLDTMKKKIVAASQPDIDTKKIQEEIKQLQNDLQTYAKSATFSGGNWLDVEEVGTQKVVASFIRDAGGAVSLETIDVDTSKIALFVNGAGSTAKGMLQHDLKLTVPGTPGTPGTPAAPIDVSAITYTPGAPGDSTASTNSTATLSDFGAFTFTEGDTFSFDITYGDPGASPTTETITLTAGVGGTIDQAAFSAALGAVFGGAVTATINGNDVDFVGANTDDFEIVISGISAETPAVPGTPAAGAAPDVSGLSATSSGAVNGTTPVVNSIAGFDALAWTAGDTFSFDVTVGTGGTPTTVSGSYDGTNWSWTGEPAGFTMNINAGALEITAAASVGTNGDAITVGNLASPATTASGITVTNFDITTLDRDQLQLLLNEVDDILSEVTRAASDLGAIKTRIASQQDFVGKLMDAVSRGVGQLVDADMTEESTRLQALQVQQQLGIQALSIANGNSQNILSLFRG